MKLKQIKYCYIFLLTIIVSCGDDEIDNFGAHRENVKRQDYLSVIKNYKENNRNYDSGILLDYQLGWNKKQVEIHTDSLLNKNIIQPKARYHVIALSDFSHKLDTFKLWLNYKYIFQYRGEQTGLLGYEYTNDKLSHLQLIVTDQKYITSGYISTSNYLFMQILLKEKYGAPAYFTKIPWKYRSEGTFELSIWLNGRKEIQLRQYMNICVITYTDIDIAEQEEESAIQYDLDEIKSIIRDDSIQKENERIKEIEDAKKDKEAIKNF